MRWILSANKEIVFDVEQLEARRNFIQKVTGCNVSAWIPYKVNFSTPTKYFFCNSVDNVNGTFITAHIGDVYQLCTLHEIARGELVIVNSCIWEDMLDKKILFKMMNYNKNVRLYFAKQEMLLEYGHALRQCNVLKNIGQFGFQSSTSERQLFANRKLGFMEAVNVAFNKVSPVILSEN